MKCSVQRSFPASPALLLILLLPVLLVSLSPAQHNSASATSSSSGHAVSGAAPSAVSFSHTSSLPGASSSRTSPSANGHNNGHPRHGASTGNVYYPYLYGVPVAYAADDAGASDEDDDDAEYQGGPTIFDRRGSGPDSYVPPSYEGPAHAQAREGSSEPPRIPPTLIFKDGHQLEIENYAVVAQTLYDLTPGHSRKIALADLDLRATQKQNDERGVSFELPSSALAN
ncbi:MAG: hypothetical protein WCA20_21770 [Candidatus Sulfotelmatobacter sp.]